MPTIQSSKSLKKTQRKLKIHGKENREVHLGFHLSESCIFRFRKRNEIFRTRSRSGPDVG